MKLSVSNIAWSSSEDYDMYTYLHEVGIEGLEIAPTRLFPQKPYEHIDEARQWATMLYEKYGIVISSMQSIWYGHNEKIFSSKKERNILIDYTLKAIDFAEAIGCKNLVFGNPKNRDTDNCDAIVPIAIEFFQEIGNYAAAHNTTISLEANPIIYNTHFLNYTKQAIEMALLVNSPGIKVNLDLGTMIYNDEGVQDIRDSIDHINHVHISEPGLKSIVERGLHKDIISLLDEKGYKKYVSIEVGNVPDINIIKSNINYIKSLMNNVI